MAEPNAAPPRRTPPQRPNACDSCGKPFDESSDGTSRVYDYWLGRRRRYADYCQPCYEQDAHVGAES